MDEQQFEATFGMPTSEAIARIRRGEGMPMPDPVMPRRFLKVPAAVANDPGYLRLVSFRWGKRAYATMFLALACLAISKFGPTHWIGLAAAVACVGPAVWFNVLCQIYRRRSKRAATLQSPGRP